MAVVPFSLLEQPTGVRWIDGKEIFQKTLFVPALPNATVVMIGHGITWDTVVEIWGAAQDTLITDPIPLPRSGTSAPTPPGGPGTQIINCALTLDVSFLRVDSAHDYSSYSGYVTVWYTKP